MQPTPSYWVKYLVQAAIEQTKDEYSRKGYSVRTEVKIGNMYADLIASKAGHKIVFEFKAQDLHKRSKAQLLTLMRHIKRSSNTEFRIVYVTPPESIQVEIEDIEQILEQELMDDLPSELHPLSTHTSIEEVTDVEFTSVSISKDHMCIIGHCNVGVRLQYGSNSDLERGEGAVSDDSFPADFELELDGEWKTQSCEFNIDTSSFYGENDTGDR